MDRDTELLDLVCGPASPLPDTHQRYRLVAHIATGGQAEVYRAVRLSGGISSAPVTVKVFRLNDRRPRADQLRSWDKGDAVLMDLNSRGVPGICRRADGFYGPPPHAPGSRAKGDPEPYQVLDYLQGLNLRDHIRAQAGQGSPLDAVGALDTLVRVLLALHHPAEPGASPVVHMDIKPSNVMVLPSGEVRLIDFTGARYHRTDHITTIAYTMEAGGPEAFTGTVGTSYDVHGFGAVAYYMVTGVFPRTDSPGQRQGPGDAPLPPWAMLRRHPVLDASPALRDHLLAPLADQPADRPGTEELTAWTARLADLVDRADTPDIGMYWGVARSARTVGRAGVRSASTADAGNGAWHRIERLEQELVELRSALTDAPPTAVGPDAARQRFADQGLREQGFGEPPGAQHLAESPATRRTPRIEDPAVVTQRTQPAGYDATWAGQGTAQPGRDRTRVSPATPANGTRVNPAVSANGGHSTRVMSGPDQGRSATGAAGPAGPGQGRSGNGVAGPEMRGVAAVPSAPHRRDEYKPPPADADRPPRPLPGARLDTLRRGLGISMTCAVFAFVCWGIWAITERSGFTGKAVMFLMVLAIGVGLFVLCRLVGRLVIEGMMHRSRSSARLSHLAVGIYLVVTGISFAGRVSWLAHAYTWVVSHIT